MKETQPFSTVTAFFVSTRRYPCSLEWMKQMNITHTYHSFHFQSYMHVILITYTLWMCSYKMHAHYSLHDALVILDAATHLLLRYNTQPQNVAWLNTVCICAGLRTLATFGALCRWNISSKANCIQQSKFDQQLNSAQCQGASVSNWTWDPVTVQAAWKYLGCWEY